MTHTISHHNTADAALRISTALSSQKAANSTAQAAESEFAKIFSSISEKSSETAAEAESSEALAPHIAIATNHVTPGAEATAHDETPVTGSPAATTVATNTTTLTNPANLNATTTAATTTASTTTTVSTTSTSGTSTPSSTAATTTPGIGALVSAIMSGSVQASYITNPSQLQETTPWGTTAEMPNVYYATPQTAQQLAQLLGGTVVQMPAFGQQQGYNEPNANFIQLPNGMTFNAADVAYYAMHGPGSAAQLTADITQTINVGSAWTNYYQKGGAMPLYQPGYIGPPISGMTYPASMIGADGNVINPATLPAVTLT